MEFSFTNKSFSYNFKIKLVNNAFLYNESFATIFCYGLSLSLSVSCLVRKVLVSIYFIEKKICKPIQQEVVFLSEVRLKDKYTRKDYFKKLSLFLDCTYFNLFIGIVAKFLQTLIMPVNKFQSNPFIKTFRLLQ